MSIVHDYAAIAARLKNPNDIQPVKYTTYITVGNRESIGSLMARMLKKELGGADQKQIDAFNRAIECVSRDRFDRSPEGDYQYKLSVFQGARASLCLAAGKYACPEEGRQRYIEALRQI